MPGVVDPHTHLDAQLGWDASGSPCVEHGVTTAVLANCGFGVAPCPPGGAEYLLRSLEAVEEIPYASTSLGVDVTWSTFTSWLDVLEQVPLGINVASWVPHSPLRYAVMGPAGRERAANADERAALADALDDSLAAGGIGLATSRGPNHVDGLGGPVPSRHADDAELTMLVERCRERIWQINVASKFGASTLVEELERYRTWTLDAGAWLTWTPCFADGDGAWREVLRLVERHDDGPAVRPQICTQAISASLQFRRPGLLGLMGAWLDVLGGAVGDDPAALTARLADSDVRASLRAGATGGRGMFDVRYGEWVVVASPSAPELVGRSVAEIATELRSAPSDVVCELALADELATVLTAPILNLDEDGRDALLGSEATLVGLGDAGAHVQTITNFTSPTTLLASAARGGGPVSIGEAVRKLTADPALALGLGDVGTVEVGRTADLAIADLATLAPGRPELRHDLPGGAARLWCGAVGWDRVIVGGISVMIDGTATGRRPGRVLRA